MYRLLTAALAAAGLVFAAGPAVGQIVVRAAGDGGVLQYGGLQFSGGAYTNPMGQSLSNLWMPQMEKELEIVPEQKEAIAKLRTEVMEQMRSLWTNTGEGEPQERMARYQEAAKKLGEDTEKKLQEILLPHQIRRLTQINLQMKLSQTGYGSAAALAGDDLAKELGLSEEQRAKLRETEQEVLKEVREKLAQFQKQLQEESREKLLGVLTASQRKKLEELTGAKFDYQQPALGVPIALPPGPGGAVQRIEVDRSRRSLEELKKALP